MGYTADPHVPKQPWIPHLPASPNEATWVRGCCPGVGLLCSPHGVACVSSESVRRAPAHQQARRKSSLSSACHNSRLPSLAQITSKATSRCAVRKTRAGAESRTRPGRGVIPSLAGLTQNRTLTQRWRWPRDRVRATGEEPLSEVWHAGGPDGLGAERSPPSVSVCVSSPIPAFRATPRPASLPAIPR